MTQFDYRLAYGVVLQMLKDSPSHTVKTTDVLAALSADPENRDIDNIDKVYFEKAMSVLEPFVVARNGKLRLTSSFCSPRPASFFDERKGMDTEEKLAVAAYIHDELLNELDAIFMDAGSACEAIAWEMACGNKGHFTVMTNNMRAVRACLTRPSIRIRLTGGTYVVDDEALVGDGAVFDPDEYSVKHAIVGASGITATHVYNHGITGEEFIKRVYWQTPAQLLIVPATLRKFGGMDACCFGQLFKEKREVETRDGQDSAYNILHDTIEEVRLSRRKTLGDFSLHRHVPRFTASKCRIIIGPQWLIDDTYVNLSERNALEQVVNEINRYTQTSFVEVVHADISRERLQKAKEHRRHP